MFCVSYLLRMIFFAVETACLLSSSSVVRSAVGVVEVEFVPTVELELWSRRHYTMREAWISFLY